jgi:response regulator of citrate/malate metabolism
MTSCEFGSILLDVELKSHWHQRQQRLKWNQPMQQMQLDPVFVFYSAPETKSQTTLHSNDWRWTLRLQRHQMSLVEATAVSMK